jgi:threonine/homoserine/homoserine lactone efflux protein
LISNLFLLAGGSFIIALSGALMPGPLLTITIGESAKKGALAGPLLILGHGILEGALVFLLLSGLSSFINRTEFKLFSFLAGGIILIIMGYTMVRDAGKLEIDTKGVTSHRAGNTVLLGIIGSLSNPYWIIWWATIGLGYLVASIKSGIPGVIAFFTGHILADLAWYSLVSTAVARGKKVVSVKYYRRVIAICGVFLFLFGGWFLYECTKIVIS